MAGNILLCFVRIHNASSFFISKYFHAPVIICNKDSGKWTYISTRKYLKWFYNGIIFMDDLKKDDNLVFFFIFSLVHYGDNNKVFVKSIFSDFKSTK